LSYKERNSLPFLIYEDCPIPVVAKPIRASNLLTEAYMKTKTPIPTQHFFSFLFIMILLMMCCACGAHYAPSTGPIANITFIDKTQGYVYAYVFKDPVQCSNPKIVGWTVKSDNNVNADIRAEEPSVFWFEYHYSERIGDSGGFRTYRNYTCNLMWKFTPKANSKYIATLSKEFSSCLLDLKEWISGDRPALKPVPFKLCKVKKTPSSGSGSYCYCEE